MSAEPQLTVRQALHAHCRSAAALAVAVLLAGGGCGPVAETVMALTNCDDTSCDPDPDPDPDPLDPSGDLRLGKYAVYLSLRTPLRVRRRKERRVPPKARA